MTWRAGTLVWLLVTLAAIDICSDAEAKSPARESNPDTITIVVPAFFSEPPRVGLNAMTVLWLQIWKTLRKAPDRNPDGLSFGNGQALWDDITLEEPTHEAAAKRADNSAQIVVWGKAYALGSGSSVMVYLTLPATKDSRMRKFEQWKLTFSVSRKDYVLIADVPSRQYSFEPISLTEALVSTYSSIDALPIYRTRTGTEPLGDAASASELFALEWEDNSVRVRTDKGIGWIRLSYLSNTTEVVDFVGGLMRIFRADWDGAFTLLSRVASNRQAPSEVRIDANLLMARAAYQLGRNVQPYLEDAEKLDRFSQRIVRYRVMGMLAELQNSNARELGEKAVETKEYLDARAHLFSADDGWLITCRELLAALAKR